MSFKRTPGQRLLPAFIGAVLALGAVSAARADATLDQIEQRHKLVVGVLLSGGPFGSIDPSTQAPRGFNVDLANVLGKDLNVAVELVPVLPANRVQFLQQGKVDLLIANMEWTPERDGQLGHVPTPFYTVGGTAAVLKDSKINRWEDLKGQPVCTSQGSSYIKPLSELGAQLKAFKSSSESLLSLRGNGCVAAVHVSPTMHSLLDEAEWSAYEIPLPTDLIPSRSVIWVRKGEKDIQARLDAIVRDWHRSGWLIELGKRTGMPPSQALHEQFKDAAPLAQLP